MKVPSIENFTTEIKITPGIRYATLNLSGHETVYLLFDSAFLYKEQFVRSNQADKRKQFKNNI